MFHPRLAIDTDSNSDGLHVYSVNGTRIGRGTRQFFNSEILADNSTVEFSIAALALDRIRVRFRLNRGVLSEAGVTFDLWGPK